MAKNLTDQVREIADVTTAVARGDLGKKIVRPASGEILQLQQTINEHERHSVQKHARTAILAYAALAEGRTKPGYGRVAVMLSGGNLDLDDLPWIKKDLG